MKPKVMIRFDKRFLIVAALFILVIGSSAVTVPVRAPSDTKIVYVAVCVDSEMLGGVGPYFDSTEPHPNMTVSEYSRNMDSTVARVFDSTFRNSHRDSFGDTFKITWFAEMDYLISQGNFVWADNSSAGVSGYTAIRDLLMNTWGTEIQTYGDSIEYHHHFMIYDGHWRRYDSGPDSGYPEYQMYALDHMIIDRDFYPSSWRSGNWIMPLALSSWLEQWIPFDYTPRTGIWYPTHPSGMDRWQTTCPYDVWYPEDVNAAFARARDYGSAVYSFCTHDQEDMKGFANRLQGFLDAADADETTYPNVSFRYVSAREAMQRALGFADVIPPAFTITQSEGTYTITSNEALWSNHPYVALKYTNGTYSHISATPTGINTWTVTPPTQSSLVETIGVAGSDLYGNPGVFVPSTIPPTAPDFGIAAYPANLAILQGSSGTSNVTVWSISGFNQEIGVSAESTPSTDKITFTLDPVTVVPTPSGNTAMLTVDVANDAQAQEYSLTVTGTNGTLLHSTGISLVVTTPPPKTVKVTIFEASPIGSGTTEPVAGQHDVAENSTFQVSATPSSRYAFDFWELDGANVGSANPYSFNVGTTSHTITPIFVQLASIQIADCDSLVSWSFTSATGNVDNSDFKEGTGSIIMGPTETPSWNMYGRLQPQTSMDFSSYSKLEMWIYVSDRTKQLRLMIATDWNNYNVYAITGLMSNGWAKIKIDLSTPTTKTGAVNFNSISFIRFEYENKRKAETLKIDDIRGMLRSPSLNVMVSSASPAGSGTTNPVAGQYQVAQNTIFTISATASSGYAFDYWELDGANVGSTNPYSFDVGTADHTIIPFFAVIPMVNVVISEASPPESGTTNPVAGQYQVAQNTIFTISATASSGYAFDYWELDGANVGSTNPYSFNVGTTSHTITPIFVQLVSVQIDSCDSLTSWWFTSASGSVDNQDFMEGAGSIIISPTSQSAWTDYAVLQKPMDFSSFSRLEMWIKVSDASKPLRLMVATNWNNYNMYAITGLTSNVWTKVTIDLSAPTSRTGTVDFKSIMFIRFEYSVSRTSASFRIDDIRGVIQ